MIDYRGHMEKYLFIKNQIVMSGLLFGGFAPMLYAATEQTQQDLLIYLYTNKHIYATPYLKKEK